MSEPVESLLIKEFFPSTREEWRKRNPPSAGRQMTRQEHVDHCVFVVNGIWLNKRLYEAYRELGWQGSEQMLPFEDAVFKEKPWLANDKEFAKWQALEPYDRFRLMVIGLPWNDEVIDLLKTDNGPIAPEKE